MLDTCSMNEVRSLFAELNQFFTSFLHVFQGKYYFSKNMFFFLLIALTIR